MTTIDINYLRQIDAITRLQGRDYLNHAGLLRVAHENGISRIETTLVSWDHETSAAVVRAVAEGSRGTFSGYGDASPANVGKNIRGATLRMAETRAVNRALRLYTGLGMTTTEELPGNRGDLLEVATTTPTPAAPTATIAQVRATLLSCLPDAELDQIYRYADDRLQLEAKTGAQLGALRERMRQAADKVVEDFLAWQDAA